MRVNVLSGTVSVSVLLAISLLLVPSVGVTDDELKETMGDALGEMLGTLLSKKKPRVPEQLEPSDGQQFSHSPATTTLKWEKASKAKEYEVEIDCYQCRVQGQWDSESGQPWRLTGLKDTHYDLTFVDQAQGRWRVRSVRDKRKSAWSPWSGFSFSSASAYPSQPSYGYPGSGDTQSGYGTPPSGYGQGTYGTPQSGYPTSGQQGGSGTPGSYGQGYPSTGDTQSGYGTQKTE